MATALQAFTNHEFGTIRTITSGGQILFCGKDVATALGYANTKDALARHCKGVVNHYPLETPGGIQQVRFGLSGPSGSPPNKPYWRRHRRCPITTWC